jgi:NhaP-type Na+/H+ or K+/H+ antiporter
VVALPSFVNIRYIKLPSTIGLMIIGLTLSLVAIGLDTIGGVLFGVLIGWLAFLLLKQVDNYTVEILLTLALVTRGYALALTIHTSGSIGIVVADVLTWEGLRGGVFIAVVIFSILVRGLTIRKLVLETT